MGDESARERTMAAPPIIEAGRGGGRTTIEATEPPPRSGHDRAVQLLYEVEAGRAEALEVKRTLGEGGMGIVYLATQVSVGRDVAVKTLRPEHRGAEASRRLLREAWTTGALEHPNVVPVHDVALGDDGSPRVVLKRIEGTDWATLLANPNKLAAFADTDPDEWNIRTLMQVCNAVHFAHQRGVIHRDLKPENVMIGRFGEVFVVDWGIAVSFADDPDPRLARLSDAREIAGTPAYMAPEMLSGDPTALGVHTDVYLLGAFLYEILTGAPPHDGPNIEAILASVLRPVQKLPPQVPRDLADICERALSVDPKDRPASADAFRAELARYLRHRDSMRLSYRAQRRLGDLMDELASGAAANEAAVQHLFGECRFGFMTACEQWPENEVAIGGLRMAVTAMARHALDARQLEAARVHLSELDPVPPDLARQLAALEADLAADADRRKALEAFERQHDPTTGSRTRFAFVALMGLLWTLVPLGVHVAQARGVDELGPTTYLTVAGSLVAAAVIVAYFARHALRKTAFNRRLASIVLFAIVSQVFVRLGIIRLDLSPAIAFPFLFYTWFIMATLVCITLERRFWPSAAAYLLSAAFLVQVPDAPFLVMSIANAVLTANVAFVWLPMAKQGQRASAA